MLLRLLIVALLALGAAQPVITGRKVPTRTVLLLDRTLPVAAQRTALTGLAAEDVVIAFDTSAILQPVASVTPLRATHASLSAGLAMLVRVRDSLSLGASEVRVAAASRFASASVDPATERLRALLRDSIALIPVTVAVDSVPPFGPVIVRADGDDPVAATALLLGDSAARVNTVIQRRSEFTAGDVTAAERGATVVHWPAQVTVGTPRLQGITVGGRTWIAPFERDTTMPPPSGARAIGWWADGAPAVWRRDAGSGCLLTVRAALPAAGDHSLSLAAQAWLRALVTACDRDTTGMSAAPEWLAPAPRGGAARTAQQTLASGFAPWLVVAGLILAAVELLVRAVRRS
jgi:hypothetical protein